MRALLGVGLAMILVGFALLFAGAVGQGNASAGGVVFIGPIPIVFGTGPVGGQLALLSLVIGAVMMALLLLWSWRLSSGWRRASGMLKCPNCGAVFNPPFWEERTIGIGIWNKTAPYTGEVVCPKCGERRSRRDYQKASPSEVPASA